MTKKKRSNQQFGRFSYLYPMQGFFPSVILLLLALCFHFVTTLFFTRFPAETQQKYYPVMIGLKLILMTCAAIIVFNAISKTS